MVNFIERWSWYLYMVNFIERWSRYLYMVNFIERWSWERPSWYFEPVKVHKHSRSCVDFPNPEGRDVFFAMFFNCSECCVLKGGMGCGGGGGGGGG